MRLLILAGFFITVLNFTFIAGCGSRDEKKVKDDSKPVIIDSSSALAWYEIEDENAGIVKLPEELNEISGICFTEDDRMFAHGDEDGDIFQIDPVSGNLIKKFYVGESSVNGDFEDISIIGERFFLVVSNGKIVEFREGSDGAHVEYVVHKTGLKQDNDVEGMCYDPETNSLLLACKGWPGKGYENNKTVYSFLLTNMAFNETPRFVIPLKKIRKNTPENEFSPSGIARQPDSGTFFIIAARGNTVIELSKEGDVINQKDLPEKVHRQAEGIAFDSKSNLYISNEGRNKLGYFVMYPKKVPDKKIQAGF